MLPLSTSKVAALSGCLIALTLAAAGSARAHPADPCDGLVTWPLHVAGLPAEPLAAYLRANPEQARAFVRERERAVTIPEGSLDLQAQQLPPSETTIDGLGIDLDEEALVALLQRLHQEPLGVYDEVPEPLRGLAGFSTVVFLQKVYPLEAEEPIADKVISGKIRDYIFVEATGRGHLAVDTCTDVLEFVPLGQDRREFIHWDIEIPEGSFSVVERIPPNGVDDPATYGNPFPMDITTALPAFTVDPADPRSVWRRGLDHKLSAVGRSIEIAHIHYRRLADPELVRYDDTHPWYDSSDASCVDLFTQGRPPGTFGELASGGYCLGRCAHPMIVNSGE